MFPCSWYRSLRGVGPELGLVLYLCGGEGLSHVVVSDVDAVAVVDSAD